MLTDTKIIKAKARPNEKEYRISDIDGLYIVIYKTGTKSWLFRYQMSSTRRDIILGRYPAISLRKAREIVARARVEIANGIDPFADRKKTKSVTFKDLSVMFLIKKEREVKAKTLEGYQWLFDKHINTALGKIKIQDLKTSHIRDFLYSLEEQGIVPTAKRSNQLIGAVINFAIIHDYITYDPSQCLKRLIANKPVKHRAYISDKNVLGALLSAMEQPLRSHYAVLYAMRILPHVFTRQKELRLATWQELDFNDGIWRIPAERMKSKREHWIPLSRQVLALFSELRQYNHDSDWVFAGATGKPYHYQAINNLLKKIGFGSDVIVPHGFRGTASTFLHEMGFDHLIIEKQLSHQQRNQSSAAYNHAEYFIQRREMMQRWSDFLDEVKDQP